MCVVLSGFAAAAQYGLHLSNPQTIPCCYITTRTVVVRLLPDLLILTHF